MRASAPATDNLTRIIRALSEIRTDYRFGVVAALPRPAGTAREDFARRPKSRGGAVLPTQFESDPASNEETT